MREKKGRTAEWRKSLKAEKLKGLDAFAKIGFGIRGKQKANIFLREQRVLSAKMFFAALREKKGRTAGMPSLKRS